MRLKELPKKWQGAHVLKCSGTSQLLMLYWFARVFLQREEKYYFFSFFSFLSLAPPSAPLADFAFSRAFSLSFSAFIKKLVIVKWKNTTQPKRRSCVIKFKAQRRCAQAWCWAEHCLVGRIHGWLGSFSGGFLFWSFRSWRIRFQYKRVRVTINFNFD